MDKITQTLLGGAALCALATAPAMAGDAPNLRVFALHGGHVIHKTRLTKTGHGGTVPALCTVIAISHRRPGIGFAQSGEIGRYLLHVLRQRLILQLVGKAEGQAG